MVSPFDPAVSRPDDDPRATGCVHPAFRTAAHNGAARLQSPRTPGGLGRRERRTGRQGDRAARRRHGVSQRRRGQAGAECRFLSLRAPGAARGRRHAVRRHVRGARGAASGDPPQDRRKTCALQPQRAAPSELPAPASRAGTSRAAGRVPPARTASSEERPRVAVHRPLGLRYRGTAGAGGTRADSGAAGVCASSRALSIATAGAQATRSCGTIAARSTARPGSTRAVTSG